MTRIKTIPKNIVETGASELKEVVKTAKKQVLGGEKISENGNEEKKRKRLTAQRNLLAQTRERQIRAQLTAEAKKAQIPSPDFPKKLEPGIPQLKRLGGLTQQVKSRQAETAVGRRGE